MKKIVLFLIAVFTISIVSLQEVRASDLVLYEGEYIRQVDIFLRKSKNGKILYQRARFFREKANDNPAYCLEPFVGFNMGDNYIPVENFNNLDSETLLKLKLLAHYGYNYPGHEDIKWYPITQFLVWQTADPEGYYEFTDGLDGPRIDPYEAEIAEIWNLVNNHLTRPSFTQQTINLVENQELVLTDYNNVLNHYQPVNPNIIIEGNTLKMKGLQEGEYTINLVRRNTSHAFPSLFYYKPSSQTLMTVGNAPDINVEVKVNVTKTKLEIEKVDKDTNSNIPSGEGKLEGAKYGLYDENENLIQELTIGKDHKASMENLLFGSYILKELSPGIGYQLDTNLYKVDITKNQSIVQLKLANEIIKKKIQIHKSYGEPQNMKPEEYVIFDVYDRQGHFVTSITTNEEGYAEIILPYGTYTLRQRTGKSNFKFVKDWEVQINEKEQDLNYELYDYKIKVPNTKRDIPYTEILMLLVFLGGICVIQKQTF